MKHKIKSVCPYCNGSGKTTLDGTFKEHKCACKNGEIETIAEFATLEYKNCGWHYKPFPDLPIKEPI